MADKNWLGADLIFDLDGDHLPGVTDKDFPAMIGVIQEQADVVERIVEPDFGFKRPPTGYISGHRGFIYITDQNFSTSIPKQGEN